MLLKNLMEDKQLNFYQPLLSVRRSSPTVPSVRNEKRKTNHFQSKIPPLPSYKSELKSGPLSNVGMVPFVWEQIPGRPKDESRPQNHAVERPPIAPKLPPGWILKTTIQDSDNKSSENPSLSKHRGEVPYCSPSVSASNQRATKLESSRDTMDVESSDSGEGDETYLDALDTLSRTESVSLNCSVSGLDGSGSNTSEAFLADLQTRDFMMGRFLPAAKAMTSETPQYAPRKQPVVWEQPRQIMNVVSGDKRPSLRYGPNIGPHYAQEKDLEESDDDYDEYGQFPGKVCGLLPRFCLKNSLCRLNPVLGMNVRTRVPKSPGSRTDGSFSSAGSSCENENEHIRTTVYEQRSLGELQATEFHEDRSGSTYELDQLSSSFPQKLEGSDLYKRLQGNGLPTHYNELSRSAFSEQKGFCSTRGEAKSIEGTGFSSLRKGEVDRGSPMIEKTLYVDIVHKVESPSINSYDSDMNGGNVCKNLSKWKPLEETPSVESSFKDTENLNVEGEANLKSISQKHVDFSVPSLADKSNQVFATNSLKGFGHESLIDDLTTCEKSKVPNNVNMDFETQQSPEAEDLEISNGNYFKFPVPPPLPKSPSDSWLWRTLPSMSSRTPSSRSHFGTRIHTGNHASKTSSVHPKWGTTVRTTLGQHQNVQSSEELLTPIPEN